MTIQEQGHYFQYLKVEGQKCTIYCTDGFSTSIQLKKNISKGEAVNKIIGACNDNAIDGAYPDDILNQYVETVKDYYRSQIKPEYRQQPAIVLTEDLTREITLDEVSDILSTSIKKDDAAKKITFLAMLLAQTNSSQINVGFQAESSAGKSYLPIELSNYFPAAEVSLIASASPTAFFHDKGEWNKEEGVLRVNLEGKVLVFMDMPGYQLLERLRPLLSHDRKILKYRITDRTQKAGMRTKHVQLIGYPCVVFASAKLDSNEQERTRMILLSPSVDQDKLQEAIRLASFKNSDPDAYKAVIENDTGRKWLIDRIRAIRQSGVREVRISDHKKLVLERFLNERQHLKARDQRDFPRVINLIKGHAMLNVFTRKREGDTIDATADDVDAGFALYAKIGESNELGLSPYVFKVYEEAIKPYLDEADGLSTKQIQKHYYHVFHKAIPSGALGDVLSQLEAANLIEMQPDPADRRRVLVYKPER